MYMCVSMSTHMGGGPGDSGYCGDAEPVFVQPGLTLSRSYGGLLNPVLQVKNTHTHSARVQVGERELCAPTPCPSSPATENGGEPAPLKKATQHPLRASMS